MDLTGGWEVRIVSLSLLHNLERSIFLHRNYDVLLVNRQPAYPLF